MLLRIIPLAPTLIAEPFDHEDWLFEVKHDGYRAIAHIEGGAASLISRNQKPLARFGELAAALGREFGSHSAILDGEVVCLDAEGRSLFYELARRRAAPVLCAFDILALDGEDLREWPLIERKAALSALIPKPTASVFVSQHVIERGRALYELACQRDLEGIVAKHRLSRYATLAGQSPWLKVKNPNYSQGVGRGELFNRGPAGRR